MIDIDIDNVDEVIIKDLNKLLIGHVVITGRGQYYYELSKEPYKDVFEAIGVFNNDREITNRFIPISKFGTVITTDTEVGFDFSIDVRDSSNREWYAEKKKQLILDKL